MSIYHEMVLPVLSTWKVGYLNVGISVFYEEGNVLFNYTLRHALSN